MRATLCIVLALLLAGCSAPEEQTSVDEPCVVEAADDESCAEADVGKRPDEVAHLHNYWGGADEVRLMEETQSWGRPTYASCDSYPIMQFLPPDGSTVYQGTGRVEITMTPDLAPDHVAGQLEVWVQRADQDAAEYVGDLDGDTIELEVPYNASDLPHQKLSAWEFWVYANPEPNTSDVRCTIVPRGSIELVVDIFNTLELQPFPGHPDHWANQTELPLLDAWASYDLVLNGDGSCLSDGASHQEGSCQMLWRGFGPREGRIVPPGTRVVELSLTSDPEAGHEGVILDLWVHGADTRTFQHVAPTSREGETAFYEIEVGDTSDGPYAKQSQWRFRVLADTDPGAYRGGWTLTGSSLAWP